jgi:F-type H+-transporting ATPase subunit epsilon
MMNLKVLLPFGIFKNEKNVQRIVVETDQGSFGLLPQRLDCVAAIVPGILLYQILSEEGHQEQEVYIAVDAGVLVKTGSAVSISVRHATAGIDLNQLHDTVEQEFLQQSNQDKQVHSVYQKMESDFMRRLTVFHHDV